MGPGESKRNATDADVRRMYIRGLKRTLKVNVAPLEETLALARIGPKLGPARKKPLAAPKQQIVVIPAAIASSLGVSKRQTKQNKPWSVGHSTSHSVFRPKHQPITPKGPDPKAKLSQGKNIQDQIRAPQKKGAPATPYPSKANEEIHSIDLFV